jgi:hypothetical protein
MAQEYSDPTRASDPYSLPDVEVWEDVTWEIDCTCGTYDVPASHCQNDRHGTCPSCGAEERPILRENARKSWWYWYCFPGCMPDSEVNGPFDSEAEAREDWEQWNETE